MEKEYPRQAAVEDTPQRLQALAGILRHRGQFGTGTVEDAIRANWDHPDRYVRKAAADLIATLDDRHRRALGEQARSPLAQATYGLGSLAGDPDDVLTRATALLADADAGAEARLAAVRLVQHAVGGLTSPKLSGTVWEGYSPRAADIAAARAPRVVSALRRAFPAGNADLDREVSRTLAIVEDDDAGVLARVAERLTADSDPVEDVHSLIVLARLRAPRTPALTERVAGALLALDDKLTRRHLNRDRHWPLRIAELYAELARKDDRLHAALLAHPDFGRPDHALFAHSPGFDRRKAAEVFLARAAKDDDYPWNATLVELLGSLPEERAVPVLRKLWDHGGLEEAILPLLARHPDAADRPKFLEGLNSPQLATVRVCLEALEKLPGGNQGNDLLTLVRALRRLPEGKEADAERGRLGRYLQRLTGQEKPGADKEAWTRWFTATYPDLAAKLGGDDGVDVAGWAKRLAALDWSAGDAERGRAVFTRASCAACHSGSQALGPDLHGVTGRFSRDDLFTAILQPSRDVSPRYRTTVVTTEDGKTYQGLIVYEAVDSLILQTGSTTTVRLTDKQIAERRQTATSLMPTGLLDKVTDRDIADLYAYLRSLGDGPKKRRRWKNRSPRGRSEGVRPAGPPG
jgi:putative heme-binding domain-containing protein